MCFALRDALKNATSEDLERHVANIEALKGRFPHSIEVVQKFDTKSRDVFNCYMFALDIHKEQWARTAYSQFGFPSSTIIDDAFTKCNINYASYGEVIVYIDSINGLKHMGCMQMDGSVISKWGSGHLWHHAVLEVPTTYGDAVQYLSREQVEKIVEHCHGIYLSCRK